MAKWRLYLALALAFLADGVQLGFFPVFGEGAASPFDDGLDVAMGVLMTLLVGWHWAFAPAFIAELVPGVDLVPTWTLAVWIASRKKVRASEQTVDALPQPNGPPSHPEK